MTLKLVSPPKPSQKAERIKKLKRLRPDGAIVCNRCGGCAMMSVRTGAYLKNGRITGGTITEKNVCAHCWKQGIHSPMLPKLQPIK